MKNAKFFRAAVSAKLIIIWGLILCCDGGKGRAGKSSSRPQDQRDKQLNISITDVSPLPYSKFWSVRASRQIKPTTCKVESWESGSRYTEGICMFVFACNQAKGTHLGICRDRFMFGSCCKLPEDDKLNEIDHTYATSTTEFITESNEISMTVPEKTNNTTTTMKPLNTTLQDSEFFSENGTLLISDPKLICGRQFLPASRIVGGNDAYFGKWPFQISVRTWQNEAKAYIHTCGAALLNANFAISAAHCFDRYSQCSICVWKSNVFALTRILNQDIILRIGDFDLSDDDYPFNYTERRVQLVIPHPKFFGPSKTFEYDLALIRFYEPVTFQPNIVPICLPENDDDLIGRNGWVTGWGRLYEGGPIPARLNEVEVPIMSNDKCENMFLKAGYVEKIPKIFLCAGWPEGHKDSCEGDSGKRKAAVCNYFYISFVKPKGGPLSVLGESKRWSLAGVISWGIGCARASHPGVYTRISEFRDWINLVSQF